MHSLILAFATAIAFSGNTLDKPACTPAVERTTHLMGTMLRITACHADREQAVAAIEAGFQEVARLEQILSSWRPTSEIGQVNGALAHTRVSISAELAQLLAEAGHWANRTHGAFDPAIGALIDVWGFREQARVPTSAQLTQALQVTGWAHARLDSAAIVRGPAGWWLDTGGFGKGAALRSLARVLRARGVIEAVVDFGGQLIVIGNAQISVANPKHRSQATTSLNVRDVSVATSSQSERFIESAGKRYGHILDPRTGQPVPAWGSVTVVTEDALAADALSTALFVMGPKAALEWAEQHPEVGVLVLEEEHGDFRAAWSGAMTKWIQES
jgi:thiamine biosynthesis lipoprotein